MEKGAVIEADLDVLAQTVWMFMHGVTSLLINSRCWKKFPFAQERLLIDFGVELIVRAVQSGNFVLPQPYLAKN
jgi:hypothetical protein